MAAIGIDLGTTYSCVAVLQPKKNVSVEVIANHQGSFTTPSYVAFTDQESLVGDPAKHQSAKNPKNTIYGVKRVIGRGFNDPIVQKQKAKWPFDMVGIEQKTKIKITEKNQNYTFFPEEISAKVLEHMKMIAEEYIGGRVYQAVITVPAHFDNLQRSATKDAAGIAGIQVLGIINEPTAAAMAYGFQQKFTTRRTVLVYDLGGGTFDATIMTIADGIFDVIATTGDGHLGGEDFNDNLYEYIIEEATKKHGKGLRVSDKARNRLMRECEVVKRHLSAQNSLQASIYLENFYGDDDLDCKLRRAVFEKINEKLFDRTLDLVKQVLNEAGMNKTKIDDVVLVGGSTRIPYIQEMLQEYFGDKVCKMINPDEAVARGAALHAAFLSGNVTAEMQRMSLRDVTPFSLGTDVRGDTMSFIIKRNAKIPTRQTETYNTTSAGQTSVKVEIYEGEGLKCCENRKLACFTLTGIPAKPAGEAKIDVCFDLDRDGILNVTATEKSAGKTERISIKMESARMSEADLNRLKQQAEKKRIEDYKWRTISKTLNDLESYVNNIKSKVQSKSSAEGRAAVNSKVLVLKCDSIKEWINQNQAASEAAVAAKRRELDTLCKVLL